MSTTAWLSGMILAVAASSCGGGQTQGAVFDPLWADDNGAAITKLQQQIARAPLARGVDVAVGVASEGGRTVLLGAPLRGGDPWRFEHALDTRPTVTGTVVIGFGDRKLFALDAATGKLLWTRLVQGRLRAAGDDGHTTVISMEPRTGRGSVLFVVTHEGEVLRQIEDEHDIGVPAVAGRYAFLPWQGQFVTALDLLRGNEAARALLRTETSRAFAVGGALFFGGAAVTRFDDKIGLGAQNKATTVALPSVELPGVPQWIPSGTEVISPRTSALDKTRIYARPSATGPAGIVGDRFAATYFRVVTGLDARSGGLAWVNVGDADFIGGAAYDGGFVLCDDRGDITFFDAAHGAASARLSLGAPLRSCVVQADGIKIAPRPRNEPLWKQLEQVVSLPDAELAAIQRFVLRELAKQPEEEVTSVLINVASQGRGATALHDEARRALAQRRNGGKFLLKALERRVDFLAGSLRAPPVGPIAEALAAMKEKKGAPLLTEHLLDPETSTADLGQVAAALAVLAGPAELPSLRTFFAMYRGVSDESLDPALAQVSDTLRRLGAVELLTRAVTDPWTAPALRKHLEASGASPARKP
ncbi:PQQ-binding-like beta-propeller repeat protein [Chondromyces crocatus]|uniref:Pyrrolo-quinoline quinone repeat domain-containing protein n=1 Tax=Chondromyces crocatus TaxID=52 RepID=A0A0K1E5W1_CHOCO|nr:PQQ-binding-like beta-propeller repeat protein [Chondromyces crocatus]AKT36265.1 uncharacterized protein CMC5_003790 [Chondromyces crocatus]